MVIKQPDQVETPQTTRPAAPRSSSWAWGLLLMILGGLLGINQLLNLGDFILALAFAGAGATFFVVSRRHQRWAVIPAYIFFALAGLIVVLALGFEALGASYVLFAIAAPFLYIYLSNRQQRWWALIPAYVNAAIGGLIFLVVSSQNGQMGEALVGAYVMFAIAAPFLFLYVRSPREWWWLIPGGITGLIGLGLIFTGVLDALVYLIPAAMILAGILLLIGRGWQALRPGQPGSGPRADRP
ncbi:MAG: hypothetical protein Kow00124_14620 [Anaerolineae bacterium]